jgi:hypothetical protein
MLHPGDVCDVTEIPVVGGCVDHRLDVSLVGEVGRNGVYRARRVEVVGGIDRHPGTVFVDVRSNDREASSRQCDRRRLTVPEAAP